MDQPKIAGVTPTEMELNEEKKYAWCTCGLSKNQPLCDGKHKGTQFKPLIIIAEENKKVHFCNCKQTENAPYCDGAHKNLECDSEGNPESHPASDS